MKKNLEVTVQTICPAHPEKLTSFSGVLSIEPDEESSKLKHGTLYTVYDVSGQVELDTSLVSKVVNDVLHNTYFTSQSASPIQPLEKAAVELREKIFSLAKELNQLDVTFNISMAVVWGEVLYLVTYGDIGMYLMRDGVLKELDTISEGSFSIASGLVKDSDFVFISTRNFLTQFTADRIFKSTEAIVQSELEARSSALVLKFNVTTEFSENEVLDIQPTGQVGLGIKKDSDKTLFKLKHGLFKLRPQTVPASKKIFAALLILLVFVAFVGSVYMLYKSNEEFKSQLEIKNIIQRGKSLIAKNNLSKTDIVTLKSVENEVKKVKNNPEVKGVYKEIESSLNEALNLTKLKSTLFYDLALVDKKASPSEIFLVGDSLVVADSASGKLYTSSLKTSKFEPEQTVFPGIKNLGIEEETKALSFTSGNSYIVYDLEASKAANTFTLPNPALTFPYLDFVYEVDKGKINKYTKNTAGTAFTTSVWVSDPGLEDINSFTIDISIYTLSNSGTVSKYTAGNKDTFEIKDLDVPLKNPGRIYTTPEINNMYIADIGNSRVVTIDKVGTFLKQYVEEDKTKWSGFRDFAISSDEKTLFILAGTKVFEVSL